MKSLFLLTMIFLFESGCVMVSHQKEPEEYRVLNISGENECVDLTGVYQNKKVFIEDKDRFFKNDYALSLAHFLIPETNVDQEEDQVIVDFINQCTLEVKVMRSAKVIATEEYYKDKGDFKCRNGHIIFRSRKEMGPGENGMNSFSSEHIELSKSVNLDLIVRNYSSGVATIFIVPIAYGNGSDFYVFRRIK